MNNIARVSVQRPRPQAYSKTPPPDDAGSYLSFYAGHVATTAAALSAASMTYGYRYGLSPWPWVATGVVSVSEGALRSAAGKYFYTDDLMGLVMGKGIGIVVPMLPKRRGASSLTLAPAEHGAQLVWKRDF